MRHFVEERGGCIDLAIGIAEEVGGGAFLAALGWDVDSQGSLDGRFDRDEVVDVFLLILEIIDLVRVDPRLALHFLVAKTLGQRQAIVGFHHVGQQREEEVMKRFELPAEGDRLGEGDIRFDLEVLGRDRPGAGPRAPEPVRLLSGEPSRFPLSGGGRGGQLPLLEVGDPR